MDSFTLKELNKKEEVGVGQWDEQIERVQTESGPRCFEKLPLLAD